MNFFQSMQNISSQMSQMKERLDKVVVEGQSGGGLVCITMNGQFVVHSVLLDKELLQKDKKAIVEELLVAAFINASEKVRERIKEVVAPEQLA